MRPLTRRRLLAGVSAATVGAVAGCTGSENPDAQADETAREGTILGAVSVENLDSTAHTVDIIIQRGDDIEHWSTHDLAAGEGVSLDSDWPDTAGEFQLTTRLDGEHLTQASLTERTASDCLELLVIVSRAGELSILTDTNSGGCAPSANESADFE